MRAGVVSVRVRLTVAKNGDGMSILSGRWRILWAVVLGAALPESGRGATPAQWTRVTDQLTNFLLVDGAKLYAMRDRRMMVSVDQGAHWSAASPVLPDNLYPITVAWKTPDFFAAGREGGMFRAGAGDAAWKAVNAGFPADKDVLTVAVTPTLVLAGTNHGIYSSQNRGEDWASLNAAIPNDVYIPKICVTGTMVFLATNTGASYRGVPEGGGYAWIEKDLRYPKAVISKGRFLFSASLGNPSPGGVVTVNRSEDNGLTWTPADSGLPRGSQVRAVDLAYVGNTLFAGMQSIDPVDSSVTPVYRSEDDGASWIPYGAGIPKSLMLQSLTVCDGALFASTGAGGVWFLPAAATAVRTDRERSGAEERRRRIHPAPGNFRIPAEPSGPVPAGEYRATGSRLSAPSSATSPQAP